VNDEAMKLAGEYLDWALQEAREIVIADLLAGQPINEENVLRAIAERTGLPLEELNAAFGTVD
jgi:predicted DsbA family dithiol-disulfide isomerase